MASELQADLKEVDAMLAQAKRPAVRQELQRVKDKLQKELKGIQAPGAATPAAPAAADASGYQPPAAPAAVDKVEKPAAAPVEALPKPVKVDVKSAGPWSEITTFDLNLGGYDKPIVTVDLRLKGVEALPKENISCDFTESSFDLKVMGLDGQNHRFVRTNLDKDISPGSSEVKVKKNHVIVQLAKKKGEYGFDTWTDLVAKGKRRPAPTAGKEADPQASIMNMMQDLYEDGDDNMKKILGEAMYKAKRGEKYEPGDMPAKEADM